MFTLTNWKIIDEYYSFKNEFPDSKYTKEVESIYKDANKYVKDFHGPRSIRNYGLQKDKRSK